MDPDKKSKLRLIAVIALVFGVFFMIWYFVFGPGDRTSVEIFVAPSDAKVVMDGKPINAGMVSIKPGKHTFEASRQYFESVKKEVDTADLGAAKTIYLALYPNSPEGEAFLAANPDEQMRYERVSGAEYSALQRKLLDEYPITTKLPYETLEYEVDYDVTQDGEVVFLVKFYVPNAIRPGTDAYKQELLRLKDVALSYLESQGVDTKKIQVKYSPDPSAL